MKRSRGALHWTSRWVIAGFLLLILSPPAAPERPFNVLVVFSESRLTPGMVEIDDGLRATINAGAPRQVQFYNEFLEFGRFGEPEYEASAVRFLKEKYARHRIDLVVTILGSSLQFIARHRAELFSDTPVVFCVVEPRELSEIGPVKKSTGVLAGFDFRGTLDAALALQPGTRRVVSVIGATPWEKFWDAQIRDAFRDYEGRLQFEHLVGLPLAQLKERVARLPGDSIVLYAIVLRDREGNGYVPEEVAEEISEAAAVPVYGLAETFLGRGIVGGSLVNVKEQGRLAGELALRVLNGENPSDIAPVQTGATRYLYDWRQLLRWGLTEKRLMPGAEVRFREPTIWDLYRWQITGVVSIVLLQTVLIAALLIQHRVRRRTEAELRENERRMSVAARTARFGLWEWNIPRDDIWITADGRALYSVTDSAPINFERFIKILHADDCAYTREAIESALQGRGDYEAEYRIALPDGKIRWIAARGQVEFNEQSEPELMRGVSIDVTTRKQAELEAERHRNELAHMNRVGMLSQLSASFAHELNQPLTAILSNSQAALRFLRSDTVDLDELRDILRDIVEDDQRAGLVIERLRALFKRGESSSQMLSLNDVVREVLKLLRSDLLTRGMTVTTELDPALPEVRGDRVQLQQVLLNLILNGCEAMVYNDPDERRLTVCTERTETDGVRVLVTDRGEGIPPHELRTIFEPFVTTKTQGTGLGLSISESIVFAHGGELRAANNPDRGATFTVVLPIHTTNNRT